MFSGKSLTATILWVQGSAFLHAGHICLVGKCVLASYISIVTNKQPVQGAT